MSNTISSSIFKNTESLYLWDGVSGIAYQASMNLIDNIQIGSIRLSNILMLGAESYYLYLPASCIIGLIASADRSLSKVGGINNNTGDHPLNYQATQIGPPIYLSA